MLDIYILNDVITNKILTHCSRAGNHRQCALDWIAMCHLQLLFFKKVSIIFVLYTKY